MIYKLNRKNDELNFIKFVIDKSNKTKRMSVIIDPQVCYRALAKYSEFAYEKAHLSHPELGRAYIEILKAHLERAIDDFEYQRNSYLSIVDENRRLREELKNRDDAIRADLNKFCFFWVFNNNYLSVISDTPKNALKILKEKFSLANLDKIRIYDDESDICYRYNKSVTILESDTSFINDVDDVEKNIKKILRAIKKKTPIKMPLNEITCSLSQAPEKNIGRKKKYWFF
jgi:hypothetical protein